MIVIHADWLISSFQYVMTIAAAEISAQSVIADWYQLFYLLVSKERQARATEGDLPSQRRNP